MVQQLPLAGAPADHYELLDTIKTSNPPEPNTKPFKRKIVWFNTLGFLALHLSAAYVLLTRSSQAKLYTILWTIFVMAAAGTGVTMGAHRLYSHKAFKAKPMLRIALIILQTVAGQNCLYIWVRDHRQHHKFSDTDGDPHNAKRGFFFSHIGWLMSRKHPDVITKGKQIDLSDLEADPYVMFQKRYYKTLYVLFSMLLPAVLPYWLWGEDLFISFLFTFLVRTVVGLNLTWLVNSAAHKFGNRPYTEDIVPVECELVSMFGLGEGWHNYHHTFPWDYKAAELGQKYNSTTMLLNMFAKWGWVYDLRAATPEMVRNRVLKRGDGSHQLATATEQPFTESVEMTETRNTTRRHGL